EPGKGVIKEKPEHGKNDHGKTRPEISPVNCCKADRESSVPAAFSIGAVVSGMQADPVPDPVLDRKQCRADQDKEWDKQVEGLFVDIQEENAPEKTSDDPGWDEHYKALLLSCKIFSLRERPADIARAEGDCIGDICYYIGYTKCHKRWKRDQGAPTGNGVYQSSGGSGQPCKYEFGSGEHACF